MARIFIMPLFSLLLLAAGPVRAQSWSRDVRFRTGNISIERETQIVRDGGNEIRSVYHRLLRDGVHFGASFEEPALRRLPTSYYHRSGPLGVVFGKYDWFRGDANTYRADVRLPASLVGLGSPLLQLGAVWSEPAVAVVGMSCSNVAAYVRPYQHLHFYEPMRAIIDLHDREKNRFFHFIPDARERGAEIRVFEGPPRRELADKAPRGFYRILVVEACTGENGEKIFLDLFTREGIAQCMELLADDGILCVHTSHRFVNLPPILAAISRELKLHARRGYDSAPGAQRRENVMPVDETLHFTSEWVMIARNARMLDAVCKTPAGYEELQKNNPGQFIEEYWSTPIPSDELWTDRGPNLLHGVLRGHPITMAYSRATTPVTDFLGPLLTRIGIRGSFLHDFSHLPRGIEQLMVRLQLANRPEVRALWR